LEENWHENTRLICTFPLSISNREKSPFIDETSSHPKDNGEQLNKRRLNSNPTPLSLYFQASGTLAAWAEGLPESRIHIDILNPPHPSSNHHRPVLFWQDNSGLRAETD
jgi:hypothetical protein